MKSMVVSHRETKNLIRKIFALGLCIGFIPTALRAQSEEAPDSVKKDTEANTPAGNDLETPSAPDSEGKTPEGEGMKERILEKIDEIKEEKERHRKETTDAVMVRRGKDPEVARYVLVGEAQTLPKNVLRFRYVRRNVAGNETFEKGGGKKDIGIDLVANVNAFVLEYGITDKFSFQILIPQIVDNQVSINAKKFATSKVYAEKYKELVEDKAVPYLISQGQCTDEASCLDKINNSAYAIPTNASLVLPTGEVYTVPAGLPVERAANSLITNGAKPKNGRTGLGDILVGGLYNVYNSKWQLASVGLGVRFPTGKADDDKGYNRTGSGFTTLGLTGRWDYRIAEPLMASLAHQVEHHMKNPTYKRHSLVDPDVYNEADANTKGADVGAPGDGDGVSNNFEVSRKAPAHFGFLKLAYALGSINPVLNPITVNARYGWNKEPEQYYDGKSQFNGSRSNYIGYELAFDGLGLQPRLPIGFTASQERTISGDNVSVATTSTYLNLILLYKF